MDLDNQSIQSNQVDPDFINKVRSEFIEKLYLRDLSYNSNSRFRWKVIADLTEALSHILTGISVIFAFSAGFFEHTLLSFISGCFGTCALVLMQFSSYAMKESKERTEQYNMILDKLGISRIADIAIDSANSRIVKTV